MSPVGLVAVSHSPALAAAAIALALEMTTGKAAPALISAAGTANGETGTDAARIAEAITEADSGDGVAVIMDLGSAVMSAELALEFIDPELATRVRLVAAPFVEGLLSAVVRAAGGASLDEVASEAADALRPKLEHLGAPSPSAASPDPAGAGVTTAPDATAEATVRNVAGLHARPAAVIAGLVTGLDASVTLAVDDKPLVSAASPIGIATLAAGTGTVVRIAATGVEAKKAVEAVRQLIDDGFGEELVDLDVPAPDDGGTSADSPTDSPTDEPPRTHPIGVSSGRVLGPIVVFHRTVREPDANARLTDDHIDAAFAAAAEALASVSADYRARASMLVGQRRDVLVATAAMADDPAWSAGLDSGIRDRKITPARATWEAAAVVAEQYRAAGGLLAERVTDLLDVRDRVIAALLGEQPPGIPERSEPYVLVADDLAPADTATLDPLVCLAIVTEQGGPTSHTAIIARELGIPAVVGYVGAASLPEGALVLVDGGTGDVIVHPDAAAQTTATGVITVPPFVGPGLTRDGHRVVLSANIGSPRDVARALERGAEGVGLFRTEFCFLDRETEPTVDEQVEQYRTVLAAFPDLHVVVRTLDAGSDKPLPFITAEHEPNPALGVRGVRTARRDPQVLERQLHAIAAAARHEDAEPWVMAPMISTVEEAEGFVSLARAAGLTMIGVMIETPSAALMAPELMSRVDFVSIGTNDLAQYTLAADRMAGDLADLSDPWQPSLLRLIRMVGEAGAAGNTPVGVCGEAAAKEDLGAVLVGLGASSLSMVSRAIPTVGVALAGVTLSQCRAAAEAACAASDPHAARAAARALLG